MTRSRLLPSMMVLPAPWPLIVTLASMSRSPVASLILAGAGDGEGEGAGGEDDLVVPAAGVGGHDGRAQGDLPGGVLPVLEVGGDRVQRGVDAEGGGDHAPLEPFEPETRARAGPPSPGPLPEVQVEHAILLVARESLDAGRSPLAGARRPRAFIGAFFSSCHHAIATILEALAPRRGPERRTLESAIGTSGRDVQHGVASTARAVRERRTSAARRPGRPGPMPIVSPTRH